LSITLCWFPSGMPEALPKSFNRKNK
jgi:hypothetical protein